MPTFRLKNLTVSLGDAAQQFGPATITPTICLFPTPCNWHSNCPHIVSPWNCWPYNSCRWFSCGFPSPFIPVECPFNSFDCRPFQTGLLTGCLTFSDECGALSGRLTTTVIETIRETTPIIVQASEEDLVALRADLDKMIEVTRARGVDMGQGGRPQTAEEIESLEKELKAALEEVQAMKKNLG